MNTFALGITFEYLNNKIWNKKNIHKLLLRDISIYIHSIYSEARYAFKYWEANI